ncbi:amidohydrolase (plasmid) [Rhizobium ruizarguesonis]|jgi:predicted TIM-barrel fold metal-dependent hydrolase|uniref:amidohydrolase family protein n=1 Tax=Rhizobium ruizarguesonis TaxID=2081791 RepID=UPI001031E07A|nr:amidohydrolase family protein [Rhizobium ruizarguesonis]TAT70103.1 amidohydrolase [Rhizobium ruizarguesonis]TAT75230.1 amidohydrolase [Rhizobium ruizarguesonis]TAY63945.1 amidohydrolase [Rhizobium ruizarguesonis]TAZ23046.1 amidohydrolase [Rhizobium ruizarguesonis]TAZ66781.1 amidohydrolase [Rhizobium ruizarguesonis]
MFRRDFLKRASVSALALLSGCKPESPTAPGDGRLLIDAHCHVFNASDLPTERFLRQVVLEEYPEQSRIQIQGIRDPDVTDEFIRLLTRLLGADKAPSADDEIAFLTHGQNARSSALSVERARASAIEDTAQHLLNLDRESRRIVTMQAPGDLNERKPLKAEKFLNFMLGDPVTTLRAGETLEPARARAASQRAFIQEGVVGRYLNWFSLFRLYRHVLVDRLISDTSFQGFQPVMLTPALVDYDEWLFQDVDKSPLPRQMAVMDVISQRLAKAKSGPVLHGYVGFDPLREVAYRARKSKVSSLVTARAALSEHGFVGVKLYPPMGFRASGNHRPYPRRTVDLLGFVPDKQLDRALLDLYKLCVELDAPILAHGYSSNGSGPDYADRGDPAYWIPVFKQFPDLRVCIAHFGRFDAPSAGREKLPFPDRSWEWRLGEFIKANPGGNVVADISYFSEALSAGPKLRQELAGFFTRWLSEFDPGCDHILYGSDWIMLGKEAGYNHYIESINSFLRTDCKLSDDACDKIFRRNALRFLPLERGSRGRERLLGYYAKHGLDPSRLPVASPRLIAQIFGR